MNIIVSYLMGFVLFVIALFLPHQTETTSISVPFKLEKHWEVLPETSLIQDKQKLENTSKQNEMKNKTELIISSNQIAHTIYLIKK